MKKILFLLLLSVSCKIFGQVNLQTGSATFSLPMFNWQDNKSRLNSVVALNYNSGNGLKVNDVASNIGQGWSLLAGGVITRIQAGEPDDQKPREGNGTIEDVSKYPAGYLYDPIAASQGAPSQLINYPIFGDKNHIYKQHNAIAADKELDHFAFSFNGRSGIFILDKRSIEGNTGSGVLLGNSKILVSFTIDTTMYLQEIRTTITSFTMQDENGLIYKFTQHELTKVLKTNYCDANLRIRTQPKFKNNGIYYESFYDDPSIVNPYIINEWYLTEIEDALTQRKINYAYSIRNIDAKSGTSISNYTSSSSGFLSTTKNYSIISYGRSVTQTPVISSILYPDGHQITFNYGKARIDLNGDFALSSVDITYQQRYLSRYQLTTSYVILNRYGNPVSDYQKSCARMYLKSIKKIGIDLKGDDPPYLFDYYLGSSATDDLVPPPFIYHRDIWGYYNGDNTTGNNGSSIPIYKPLPDLSNGDLKKLCFYNHDNIYNAKPSYAKNGLLRQITYPAGGSLNYEYNQTVAILNNQNINAYGVHVSKTSVTDGGYNNDCNHPIVTNYSYTLQGSMQSSLWGIESPVNAMLNYNTYLPEFKYFYYKPILDFGCDFHYKYPGILSREQATNITELQQLVVALSKLLQVIGDISQIIDVVHLLSNLTGPGAVIIDIISDLVNIGLSCIGDHHRDNTTTIYYNSDLNTSNPLPVQFKRVEVSEASGQNGKTVYEFTSNDDYPIWEPVNNSFSAKQRFAYWAYGLPKKITSYDAIGNPVKQTENIYDTLNARKFFHGKVPFILFPCCKTVVQHSFSKRNTNWTTDPITYQESSDDNLIVDMYEPYTGRIELSDTYERIYNQSSSSQFLETATHYTYNSTNFQVNEISTTQSNGDINYKTIRYSCDFSGGLFTTLNQNNIIALPVSTSTSVGKSTGLIYLGESVTEFSQLSTGDIKPYRILEQRFNQPVVSMQLYQGPTSQFNPVYKETQTFTYDASANLISMKDEGNHVVANIYDYDDKYVVASVVNADAVLDRPCFSSFETTGFGGWTLGGAALYNTSVSVTGARSFTLTTSGILANNFSATLNTAKAYRLSLWATGVVNVTNSNLIKSAPTINGFTYYEYNISQGASTVTVTGNANIDELRLYPQTARMRTVTYDPLIGKTSECDENNRITYYEYDEHGRLRFIKDENKNVVKMYEYNVAKKVTGCPVTFFNLAVSEIFIKQCAAGYTGSTVTYTIPEGKYTSTVSQDAVDIQVQNELNTLGQAYANTSGTCTMLYYNAALSQNFTKEDCPVGYVGSSITYSVPAGKYSSTVSQADADEQAQDEIDANGQAFANLPGNASCIISPTPVWIGTGIEQCQNGHKMVQVVDQNPNSSTYNQTQWIDTGTDPTCEVSQCNSQNCSGVERRCVNGYCEQGVVVYTGQTFSSGKWYCIYHYEWSDGYWSPDYLVESSENYCPNTN